MGGTARQFNKMYIDYKKILESQWCPWKIGYADALGKNLYLSNE